MRLKLRYYGFTAVFLRKIASLESGRLLNILGVFKIKSKAHQLESTKKTRLNMDLY